VLRLVKLSEAFCSNHNSTVQYIRPIPRPMALHLSLSSPHALIVQNNTTCVQRLISNAPSCQLPTFKHFPSKVRSTYTSRGPLYRPKPFSHNMHKNIIVSNFIPFMNHFFAHIHSHLQSSSAHTMTTLALYCGSCASISGPPLSYAAGRT
jgi:hypothetical protein